MAMQIYNADVIQKFIIIFDIIFYRRFPQSLVPIIGISRNCFNVSECRSFVCISAVKKA
jgi:hypothetical protein